MANSLTDCTALQANTYGAWLPDFPPKTDWPGGWRYCCRLLDQPVEELASAARF